MIWGTIPTAIPIRYWLKYTRTAASEVNIPVRSRNPAAKSTNAVTTDNNIDISILTEKTFCIPEISFLPIYLPQMIWDPPISMVLTAIRMEPTGE